MVIERKLFGCEICGNQYKTLQKARSCEDQGMIEAPTPILSHLYRLDIPHENKQKIYALFMDHVETEAATYPGHFPEYNTVILKLTSSYKKNDLAYSLTQHQLTYDPGQLTPVSVDEYVSLKQLFLEHDELHTEEFMHYTRRMSLHRKKIRENHPIIYSPLESAHLDLEILVDHEKYESAAKLREIILNMEKESLHHLAWPLTES